MKNWTKTIERLSQARRTAVDQLKQTERDLKDAVKDQSDAADAVNVVQVVAQGIQNEAHKRIAVVVSKCLRLVFDDPYTFSIEFTRKANRTHAEIQLKRGDIVLDEPIDSASGGAIDVASFALRVACLLLKKPQRRRLIVMDEPFKFVHPPERRPRVVAMLEYLADEFDVQFIFITGIDELKCGTVLEAERRGTLL